MNKSNTETITKSATGRYPAKPSRRLRGGVVAFALLIGVVAVVGPGLFHNSPVHGAAAPETPTVTVSQPLPKDIQGRLQFLGQFSAVEQVELRAQVGGTLTHIGFTDGAVVRAGDLLFEIDSTQYQIKLANATAQVEKARTQAEKARTQVEKGRAQVNSAHARLDLASQELTRANTLQKTDAGTVENVEQRSAERVSANADLDEAEAVVHEAEASFREAEAAGHEAEALVRDAQYDLDHTHVYAPFTGRIGTHLVSVGNLVLGNRGGGNTTTLLATMVSLDPIYFNFDMSEADYLSFERERATRKTALANKVEVSLTDENRFARQGILNFLDNVLDRSSGTIHARATVPNADLFLTPGVFGRVRVNLSAPKQVLLVPDASVTADQTDRMVLIVGPNDVVGTKKVEIGALRYGLRVINSGLNPTDRVIIGGPPVAPGTKVSPRSGAIVPGSDEGAN
jgi:RND family efflux transporter MFP subunit